MKRSEYASMMGLTIEQLRDEEMSFLQNEGYDDAGREYETLTAWIKRRPTQPPREPFDGGRGAGTYGMED